MTQPTLLKLLWRRLQALVSHRREGHRITLAIGKGSKHATIGDPHDVADDRAQVPPERLPAASLRRRFGEVSQSGRKG